MNRQNREPGFFFVIISATLWDVGEYGWKKAECVPASYIQAFWYACDPVYVYGFSGGRESCDGIKEKTFRNMTWVFFYES